MKRRAKTLLIILLGVASLQTWSKERCKDSRSGDEWAEESCQERSGRYENQFGFRVIIPKGRKGLANSPPGLTDHGVVIPLVSGPEGEDRFIELYAGFNHRSHQNIHDAIEAVLDDLRNKAGRTDVTVESQTPTEVGGLKVIRTLVRFHEDQEMFRDFVMIVAGGSPGKGSPQVEYDFYLHTTPAHYRHDRKVFDHVLSTIQFPYLVDTQEKPAAQ